MKNSTLFWTIICIGTLIKLILWRINLNCPFGSKEGIENCTTTSSLFFDFFTLLLIMFLLFALLYHIVYIIKFINNILDNKLKFEIKIKIKKDESKSP